MFGQAGEATTVALRDGLEFFIEASASTLPEATEVGVFVGLFSAANTGTEARVEEWMVAGGTPPRHNPLRLWTMFSHQYSEFGGAVQPDELGDSCFGEAWRAEFCARVWTCFRSRAQVGGGARWRIAAAVRFAAGYRLEAYLGPPLPSCKDYLSDEDKLDKFPGSGGRRRSQNMLFSPCPIWHLTLRTCGSPQTSSVGRIRI
eukprot:symbB.v1.2.020343.t1/scaffold1698.1/size105523/8